MSLEQAILGLTEAVTLNNFLLQQMVPCQASAAAPSPAAVLDDTAKSATAESKPAGGKKKGTRAAPVTTPTAEPEAPAASDDDGFGDDAFGDDDGFGDEPAPLEKAYTGTDAMNAFKALRDVLAEKHDRAKALDVAKAALKETGFGNINEFTDETAAKAIGVVLRFAVNHGVQEPLKAKAKQYGSDL